MATSTDEHVLQKRRLDNVEISFAQRLAGNEKKIRDRAVKKLKQWIEARSKISGSFSEDELLKLWKGLFYCMWMSDKPLVQEELADKIAALTHCFATWESALAYFDACIVTIKREWAGIDYLRIDKFMMMVRKCLAQALVVLKQNEWQNSLVDTFLQILTKTPLNPDDWACPDGLRIHISDILREELAKIGGDQLSKEQVMKFVDPFCVLVTTTNSKSLSQVMLQEFFGEIVTQSDIGMDEGSDSEDEGIQSGEETENKGMKGQKIGNNIEEKKEQNNDENPKDGEEFIDEWEEHLAEIPHLQFDYAAIADRLLELAGSKDTLHRVRRNVYLMVKKLKDLAAGFYPMPNLEELEADVMKLEVQVAKETDTDVSDKVRLMNEKKRNRRRQKKMIRSVKDKEDHETSDGEDIHNDSEVGGEEDNEEKGDDKRVTKEDHSKKQALKKKRRRKKNIQAPITEKKGNQVDKILSSSVLPAPENAHKKRKRRRNQKQQPMKTIVNQGVGNVLQNDGAEQEDGSSPAKVMKLDNGDTERVKRNGINRAQREKAVEVETDLSTSVGRTESYETNELKFASPPNSTKKRKIKSKAPHSKSGATTSSKDSIKIDTYQLKSIPKLTKPDEFAAVGQPNNIGQSEDLQIMQSPPQKSKAIVDKEESNKDTAEEDKSARKTPVVSPSLSSNKKTRKSMVTQDDKFSTPKNPILNDDIVPKEWESAKRNTTPVEKDDSALVSPPSSLKKNKKRRTESLKDYECTLQTNLKSSEDTVPKQEEATPTQKIASPMEKEITPISKRTRRKSAMLQAKLQDGDADISKEVTAPATLRSKQRSVAATPNKGIKLNLKSPDIAAYPGSAKKRVFIALSQNEVRAPKDYRKRVQSSPGIPFDSTKKPVQPALKFTPPTTRSRSKATSAKKSAKKTR